MAKSLRSKIKKSYRALKRDKLKPVNAKKLAEIVAPLHEKAGLKQSSEADDEQVIVKHGGVQLDTSFVPDHARPKLNVVHGPNAEKSENADPEMDTAAAANGDVTTADATPAAMDTATDKVTAEKPATEVKMETEPRRSFRNKGISKRRKPSTQHVVRRSTRHPKNKTRKKALESSKK